MYTYAKILLTGVDGKMDTLCEYSDSACRSTALKLLLTEYTRTYFSFPESYSYKSTPMTASEPSEALRK